VTAEEKQGFRGRLGGRNHAGERMPSILLNEEAVDYAGKGGRLENQEVLNGTEWFRREEMLSLRNTGAAQEASFTISR